MTKKRTNPGIIKSVKYSFIWIILFALVVLFNRSFDRANDFDKEKSFVRIIDVGQGDSALIYSKGYSALIDTGVEDSASSVIDCLKECEIEKLDVLMITHLDTDHIGGIDSITDRVDVDYLLLPELSVESEGLTLAELAVNKTVSKGGEVLTAKQGQSFKIGEFEITVLAQLSQMAQENNRSVVAMAKKGSLKFLFTGDIEVKAERALLKEGLNLECDVLKVAHHGSSTSTKTEFLKAVNPSYAVISVGNGNRYGHPHSEVLSALEGNCKYIYRTDIDGDITFFAEDNKIKVETEK